MLVSRAAVGYPHVWYAGRWPTGVVARDAAGVFCELLTRRGATTWFLPEADGVLGAPLPLPRDCALLDAPSALFP